MHIGHIYSVAQPAGQQSPGFFADWRHYMMFLVTASSLENFREGAEFKELSLIETTSYSQQGRSYLEVYYFMHFRSDL